MTEAKNLDSSKMQEVKQSIRKINLYRVLFFYLHVSLILLRAVILAFGLAILWKWLQPQQSEQAFLVFVAVFFAVLCFERWSFNRILEQDLLFALEIKYPNHKILSANSTSENSRLSGLLKLEFGSILKLEGKKVFKILSSMMLPGLLSLGFFIYTKPSFIFPLHEVLPLRRVEKPLLKILAGSEKLQDKLEFVLGKENHPRLQLLLPNLLEISFRYSTQAVAPTVSLREFDEKVGREFQSFQMTRDGEPGFDGKALFRMTFAVTQNVQLFIPEISPSEPLASVDVKNMPVPKLRLTLKDKLIEPWPDDKPLKLEIFAKATQPLQQINLLIRVGDKHFKELVNTVANDHTLSLSSPYSLLIERFVEQDHSEVEIMAEGVDRSLPIPLVGLSEPLVIRTISGYGRYSQVLGLLKDMKGHIELGIKEKKPKLNPEVAEIMQSVMEKSNAIPFFDEVDRWNLLKIQKHIQSHLKSSDMSTLYDLSEDLGNFLEEHELLDDRERDRDYFVAIRGLSRMIEQDTQKSDFIKSREFGSKIQTFLDERVKRWKIRVSRLEKSDQLKQKDLVLEQRMFQKTIETVKSILANRSVDHEKILKTLSQSGESYRQWISDLEALEDSEREEREKKQQEGLASARDELVALQKKQALISSALDHSATRTGSDLEEQWPLARMNQNSNVKGATKLAQKLQSLSPRAAQRINLAVETMKSTLDMGGEKNFVAAETYSDLSTRLLHQAQQASQKPNSGQGRKRRRVAGDNYYGQALHGGDIEINREYQVDRRYREDILDEINDATMSDEKNLGILNSFLRRIIR